MPLTTVRIDKPAILNATVGQWLVRPSGTDREKSQGGKSAYDTAAREPLRRGFGLYPG